MKGKKLIVIALVMAVFLSMLSPAFAVLNPGTYSESDKISHSGSYSKNYFSATLSWPNLTNKVKWSGSSYTRWYGTSPYNADSIKHTNTVSVSGIGSLSLASDSAGVTIDGSSMSDTMSITNDWCLTSNFNYTLKRGIFITGSNFSTSGRVQIGSRFYSMSCTT